MTHHKVSGKGMVGVVYQQLLWQHCRTGDSSAGCIDGVSFLNLEYHSFGRFLRSDLPLCFFAGLYRKCIRSTDLKVFGELTAEECLTLDLVDYYKYQLK